MERLDLESLTVDIVQHKELAFQAMYDYFPLALNTLDPVN